MGLVRLFRKPASEVGIVMDSAIANHPFSTDQVQRLPGEYACGSPCQRAGPAPNRRRVRWVDHDTLFWVLATEKNIWACVATLPADAIALVFAIDPFHIVPSASTTGIDSRRREAAFAGDGAAGGWR